jgi:hypothetical protein
VDLFASSYGLEADTCEKNTEYLEFKEAGNFLTS